MLQTLTYLCLLATTISAISNQRDPFQQQQSSGAAAAAAGKCSNCPLNRASRENATREIIRNDILKKLGMDSAPQLRIKDHVPRKLLKELMSKHSLSNQMQGDQGYGDDQDDDHVSTEEVFIMAKKRKSHTYYVYPFYCGIDIRNKLNYLYHVPILNTEYQRDKRGGMGMSNSFSRCAS